MIVFVLLPRFQLTVAAGGRAALLRGPAALAPEPGRERRVGEASAAADAHGVRAGMALGEALARCPELVLVPPDPAAVAEAWERELGRLEGIGAAVEPARPGQACFEADGLLGLHGGALEGAIAAARRALRTPARIGAAPTRFCALAAAGRARARRAEVVPARPGAARAYLAAFPVSLLGMRPETAALCEPLTRLGIATLGALVALPRPALADRFGAPGLLAHDLASGRDGPLRPRRPGERVVESIELPEAALGPHLEQALGVLIDRVLARPERRGRTLRVVVVTAVFVEHGAWRERFTFREALADPARMRAALVPLLGRLAAPAEALRLGVEAFGPPARDQRSLTAEAGGGERGGAATGGASGGAWTGEGPAGAGAGRRARLREAVHQARAAAGPDAALRVLATDPDSRVPERRAVLTPFDL